MDVGAGECANEPGLNMQLSAVTHEVRTRVPSLLLGSTFFMLHLLQARKAVSRMFR